jgi:hypothetical protein
MTSAMNVVCNKDLFVYIQQFINGEVGIVRNFRLEIGNNLSIIALLEEALVVTNWKVVERIDQPNQEYINDLIINKWLKNYPRNYGWNIFIVNVNNYLFCQSEYGIFYKIPLSSPTTI